MALSDPGVMKDEPVSKVLLTGESEITAGRDKSRGPVMNPAIGEEIARVPRRLYVR